MSAKAKQDIIVSVVLYGIVGFFFFMTKDMPADSSVYPRIILSLIAILNTANVIIVITNDKKKMQEGVSEGLMLDWKTAKLPLAAFAGTCVYTALFMNTNYFIATALMIPIFMVLEKVKPRWLIAVMNVCYLGFIYWLFVVMLNVRLIR